MGCTKDADYGQKCLFSASYFIWEKGEIDLKIAFGIIVLIIILISFFGAVGEQENKDLAHRMTALCIAAIIGFVLMWWLV